ncbi:MAG: type II and III secretion system protein [Nanoarchaeota archaeon]|nr:type II and III secretion system protein [Nanoarchaeota archaeon]
MRSKIIKKIISYSCIAGLAFSAGCSYINSTPKPNLLGEYSSISNKSTALLEKEKKDINVELISEGKLPIYNNQFKVEEFGDFNIIRYNSRNMDSSDLEKILEEQMKAQVETITSVPGTNQILIKIKKVSELEKQVEKIINSIDVMPPQIMLDLRIVKLFADYTRDISSSLNLKPKEGEGLYPALLSNLPGAKVRVPERAAELGLGVKYGVVGEIGRYLINTQLDQLESFGFAKDLARTSLVVSNGKKGEIRLTQELPYQDQVFQGGAILELTKYKEIDNFLEITPSARDNGNIYLDIFAGVGSYNPTGVLQIPGIVKRNVKISGLELKEGETIILGGFRIDHTLAVERKDPWFSTIPVLGYLFKSNDKEKSTNEVLFIATPHYLNIDKSKNN